jgi:hypothetical protein
LEVVDFWYPIACIVVLCLVVVAIKLHWAPFFGWFGYQQGHMTVAKDVRDVFVIP